MAAGMIRSASLLRLLLAFLGLVAFAPAQAAHIAASLVAETQQPAPGSTVTLAIVMQPQPGWHGYWKNPGDAGQEMSADWNLPAGIAAGSIAYPVPQTLIVSGLMNYVFEKDYAPLVDLRIPAGVAAGTKLPVRVKLDWLACTDQICVPEKGELAIDLVAGSGAADAGRRGDFDRWRAALPRPLDAQARFQIDKGIVRIGVPLPASTTVQDAYFFPLTDGVIDYAAPQTVSHDGDLLTIETKAKDGGVAPQRIDGVLKIGDGGGLAVTAAPGVVAPGSGGGAAGTFLLALGGALLGGLLLNVMPCVFPILSLKALSLAKANGAERTARLEALAYTAGVVLVCVALGGLLLALRAGGGAAGWAFQLQDPRVIVVLLLLVSAIALNLAGLFELPAMTGGGALAASGGTAGAFWTGALAAFVATPCTGPFMGAALGAALVLPPAAALAVFAGLGLGLALPFLLLGFVPALRRRLPKPGAWMDRFRRILSLPMFATALGLAWILGRLAGVDGMTLGLGAALIVAMALWWVGQRQARGISRAWWPLAPAAALLGAMGVIAAQPAAAELPSEQFSEARLAALQGEKRPIFVYFTADWCLTCKVNEKAAIERSEVVQAFGAKKVAVLVGDWTKGDATISRFLSEHGRSGVPFYLFYPAGGQPQELPQVLTPGMLVTLANTGRA
jgi:DsbC/DsbD-like thiol-disulfide interchange protein/cytochrome c biogenesis protein CcdA